MLLLSVLCLPSCCFLGFHFVRRRFPPFLQEQKKDLVKFENVIEIQDFYEIFCDFFVYGMVHLSPGILSNTPLRNTSI